MPCNGILKAPVKCYLGHGDELGVLLVLLTDVGEAAEDEHAHDDHQHQQTQLLVADRYIDR